MMKAVVISHPGKSDVLQLADRPLPLCGDDEVLIRVMAAGVNRPDVAQRKGNYPPPQGASPDIPGLEVAGVVEEVGNSVTAFKKGDSICALLTGGGYAQYCVAPHGQCLPVPKGFSFVEAASLPETFFTVWSNVFDRGGFKRGEVFLVHGGTSGIGVAAIQMVKAFEGTIYATAGSSEKCKFCESLGAARGINYKEENFKDVVQELAGSRGVDVILDMIGGPYTQPNLELLAEDGRLVLINFMKGDETTIRLSQVMRKRLTITGSTLRARDATFKAAIAANLRTQLWPLLESGRIKPIIYKTFPLADAAKAHDLMEGSTHIGKIVLVVSEN